MIKIFWYNISFSKKKQIKLELIAQMRLTKNFNNKNESLSFVTIRRVHK